MSISLLLSILWTPELGEFPVQSGECRGEGVGSEEERLQSEEDGSVPTESPHEPQGKPGKSHGVV